MSLVSNSQSREEELVELFSPVKNIRATLILSSHLQFVIDKAVWDQGAQSLVGQTSIHLGSGTPVDLNLKCKENHERAHLLDWDCEYRTSLRREPVIAHFALDENGDGDFGFFIPPSLPSLSGTYQGVLEPKYGKPFSTRLILESRPESEEDDLLSFVRLTHPLRTTLVLSNLSQVVFDGALWNYETQTLTGDSQLLFSGKTIPIRLECKTAQELKSSPIQWNCNYVTGLRSQPTWIRFSPSESHLDLPKDSFSFHEEFKPVRGSFNGLKLIKMVVESKIPTSSDELMEIIDYIKPVRVVLTFNADTLVSFESALWFRETGSLTGKVSFSYMGIPYDIIMECQEKFQPDNSQHHWSCHYRSTLNGVNYEFEVIPSNSIQLN